MLQYFLGRGRHVPVTIYPEFGRVVESKFEGYLNLLICRGSVCRDPFVGSNARLNIPNIEPSPISPVRFVTHVPGSSWSARLFPGQLRVLAVTTQSFPRQLQVPKSTTQSFPRQPQVPKSTPPSFPRDLRVPKSTTRSFNFQLRVLQGTLKLEFLEVQLGFFAVGPSKSELADTFIAGTSFDFELRLKRSIRGS